MDKPHYLLHSKLYFTWGNMIDRCTKPKHKSWKSYGAKGVVVCEEWLNDFIPFYNWALANGYKEGLQIDKDIKGNGKLYSPETCMWVTGEENNEYKDRKFKKYLYNGELCSMSQLSKLVGISFPTLDTRINKMGLSVDEAVANKRLKPKKIDLTSKLIEKHEKNESVDRKIRRFASKGISNNKKGKYWP